MYSNRRTWEEEPALPRASLWRREIQVPSSAVCDCSIVAQNSKTAGDDTGKSCNAKKKRRMKTYLSLPTECRGYQFAQRAHYSKPVSRSQPARRRKPRLMAFCSSTRYQVRLQEVMETAKNKKIRYCCLSKLWIMNHSGVRVLLDHCVRLDELSSVWLILEPQCRVSSYLWACSLAWPSSVILSRASGSHPS